MSETNVIHVANDFYPRPSGRYAKDGMYTGESFREKFLVPRLRKIILNNSSDKECLIVDFTGVTMAGSSFLEEAFGGLVRKHNFSKDELRRILDIQSPRRPVIKTRIQEYISEA